MILLKFLQKNLVWSIPVFMLLGLLYGQFFTPAPLKALILPFTFLMVYPMMVNLNLPQIFARGDGKLQLVTQVINFGVIPLLGLLLGKIFFADSPLIMLGLLLTSLLPTSGMTISWTGFARGNMPAAVKMTVIGLLLGSLLTPLYLQAFLGATVQIPLLQVFQQIAIIVFLPMLLGYLTRRLLLWRYGEAKYQKDLKQKFPPFSTLGVLSIVFIAMSLKSQTIVSEPTLLLRYLLPLVIIYLLNFTLSTLVGKYFFTRGDAIALVYGTVMRNLSIALAIAMTVFGTQGSEIALIIALAYIIQVQAGAWFVRFTVPIFGPLPPDTAADVMHLGVFALHATDTVQAAINLFAEEHIHSVAVLDSKEKALGILDSTRVFAYLADPSHRPDQTLSALSMEPATHFTPQTPLATIIRSMRRQHHCKILILDPHGLPTGVITVSDLLAKIS